MCRIQSPEQHWRSEQPAKAESLSQDRRCRPVRKDETYKRMAIHPPLTLCLEAGVFSPNLDKVFALCRDFFFSSCDGEGTSLDIGIWYNIYMK